ncbi:hypothetical protein C2845_PM07G07150 [Panicum miliaceum]|uniref:Uncharacterized protein n=1 Tax=Panicum miliaceum TaxID=4540 RepID=A0A3L6SQ83_PANMI|nr:hypothetical protein C2845_PM07G07150 [Panicum miliaceum]
MHNARVGAAAPQPPPTCCPFFVERLERIGEALLNARRRSDRSSTNVDPKRSPRLSPASQPTNKGGGEAYSDGESSRRHGRRTRSDSALHPAGRRLPLVRWRAASIASGETSPLHPRRGQEGAGRPGHLWLRARAPRPMRRVGNRLVARSVKSFSDPGRSGADRPDADPRLRFALSGPVAEEIDRWRGLAGAGGAGHARRVDVHVHAKMRPGPRARTGPKAPDGDAHRGGDRKPTRARARARARLPVIQARTRGPGWSDESLCLTPPGRTSPSGPAARPG